MSRVLWPPAGVDSSFRWNDETVVILACLLPAGRLRSVLVINYARIIAITHSDFKRGKKNNSQGRAIGKTRGSLNSKLHLVCDGQGRPVHLHLTAGNRADLPAAGRYHSGPSLP